MGNANPRTPWTKIERLFRAGVLSIYEIARETNTPEANIRYHAKKNGWKRDLTDEMRSRTRTKLVESLAAGIDTKEDLRLKTDEQIIELAARTQVEVVRQHQTTLGNGHSLTMRMLSELDAATTHKGELEQLIRSTVAPIRQQAALAAVSLSARATTLRNLASSAREWITMERQAFNIAEDRGDNKEQRKLDEMTAEQLRQEILDDAKKMGLDLNPEDIGSKAVGIVAKATNGSGMKH